MKAINCKREHPLLIVKKVIKAIPILLIPLIFLLFPNVTAGWRALYFYRFYIFILLPVLIWAIIYRYSEKIGIFSNQLRLKRGVFLKNDLRISNDSVSSVTIENTPVTSIFKSKRLIISSTSFSPVKLDFILPKGCADLLAQQITNTEIEKCKKIYTFLPSKIHVMSAVESNWTGGLLILIPFFKNSSRILGNKITDRVYSDFTDTAARLLPEFNPIIAIITSLIFFGWTVHYLSLIVKNSRFSIGKSENAIFTLSGLVSRRHRIIPLENISGIEYKSTFMSYIFNLASVRALTRGLCDKKSGDVIIIPSETVSVCKKIVDCIFEKSKVSGKKVTPKKEDKSRYCTLPAVYLLILVFLGLKFGAGKTLVSQLFFFIGILDFWWLIVRFLASKRAFLRLDSDSITICGPRGFSICRQRIFRDNIEKFAITSNPIQQYAGICNVYLRAKGVRKGVKCYHLTTSEAMAIAERLL